MFVPDPANLVGPVILILGEPKLSFLANHVENLSNPLAGPSTILAGVAELTSPAT